MSSDYRVEEQNRIMRGIPGSGLREQVRYDLNPNRLPPIKDPHLNIETIQIGPTGRGRTLSKQHLPLDG